MRRIFSTLVVAAAAFSAQIGAALAVGEDVFVVPRVPVQAQAETATAAKSIAQTQGRRRAMDILLRRVTIEADWLYLPALSTGAPAPAGGEGTGVSAEFDPYASSAAGGYGARAAPDRKMPIALTDHDLETLESSFEVYAEKSSATTYRAYITYRFKPDAVRRLLKNARLPYSETQTRTALVLPVLQTDNGVYLWESNNPWMAAWKSRPLNNELTPMAAPLGDLEDAALITAREALALNAEKLAALADYYVVSQVIVAHARLKQQDGQDQLTVRLVNAHRESAALAPDVALDPAIAEWAAPAAPVAALGPGQHAPDDDFAAKVGDVLAQTSFLDPSGNFPGLAERAIEATIAKYASGWKALTLIDHSSEAVLETSAFFDSLQDWTKIRTGLVATPLVASVQVFALSPRGADMRLRVFGDPRRLTVAMENYGVVFWTEDGEQWLLATPKKANALRGSRQLRRRRGLLGEDNTPWFDALRTERTTDGYNIAAPETKIDQRN